MKILIVENDDYKLRDILKWVETHFSNSQIDTATSFRAAGLLLRKKIYDLCLLDMALPSFSDSDNSTSKDSHTIAGRQLINFAEKTETVKKVVIITQFNQFAEHTEDISFETMMGMLQAECPKVYLGAVRYCIGDDSWEKELSEILKTI